VAEIGHNNPPEPLTAKVKLQRIEAIIERKDLSAAQKCVGVGIVVKADRDGVAEAKTQELMDFASVKDRETVFRATKTLHDKEIVEKANKKGQSGRYNVMPPKVIEAIIAARDEMMSRQAKADGMDGEAGRVEPDGIENKTGRVSPDQAKKDAVGFEPTPVKPVGSEPTTSKQDAPAHVPVPADITSRANKEYPSDIIITSLSEEEREREARARPEPPIVEVNCSAIYGPGFTLDFGAIDMAAALSGVPVERARQIAEICARDWAANGTKPSSPMAMVKRAIASDRNHKQTDDARVAAASKATPASKRDLVAQWAREEEERIKAEKPKWRAR
jgi:hypothetical protein